MKDLYYNRDGTPSDSYAGETSDQRRIGDTTVGKYWVSTVFLSINHQWNENLPPLIFETMVFIGQDMSSEQYCDRYTTEEQAKAGHDKVVAYITEHGLPPTDEDVLL